MDRLALARNSERGTAVERIGTQVFVVPIGFGERRLAFQVSRLLARAASSLPERRTANLVEVNLATGHSLALSHVHRRGFSCRQGRNTFN